MKKDNIFIAHRKSWLLMTALILLAIIYLAARAEPQVVIVKKVRRGPIREEISDFGTTKFKNVLTFPAANSGWLSQMTVNVGESVERGITKIATVSAAPAPLLDPRTQATLRAQLETARAQTDQARLQVERAKLALASSEKELRRTEGVFKVGAVSQQEFDNLKAKVADLRKELRVAESGLDASRHQEEAARSAITIKEPRSVDSRAVTVPVSGIVSWIYDERPRFVTTGTPLIDIAQPGSLRYEIDILARDAMRIKSGLTVRFTDFPLGGKVKSVAPTALPKISPLGISEQRTRVWIDFDGMPAENVPAGLELEAHIELATRASALTVPSSAVWQEEGNSWVFKEKDGKIEKVRISTGISSARETEVTAGLNEGDWIVQLPSEENKNGQKVSPVRE
ncbi:MAG: efflux RND transporter periplasmic adaptor subunit [Silvanigrellaceae bacterium]